MSSRFATLSNLAQSCSVMLRVVQSILKAVRNVQWTRLNFVCLKKMFNRFATPLNIDIDIIALSETRLSSKIEDPAISIEGCKIFRQDRDEKGGGAAIYVKEQIPDPLQGKSFYVISWYRPPTGETDTVSFENLREFLKKLDRDEKEIILVGDTNCHVRGSPLSSNAKKLQSVYAEYQIEQLIKAYTG